MDQGYIKLWRKSLDSGLMQNPNLWFFWCWCLLKASHKRHKQMVGMQVVELQPGQFIFGRKAASKDLGISERKIRTCVEKLKKLQNLTTKPTNRYSIISIVNWDTYQQTDCKSGQQSDQQVTSKRPASDHKQECKNVRINKKPSSKSNFEGDGSEVYKTKKKRNLTGKRLISFLEFWEAFGYKSGKAEAADAWLDIPELTDALVDRICNAAKNENQNRAQLKSQGKTPKMAQGWLTGRRWEDEACQAVGEARAQAEGKAQTRRVAEDAALAQNQAEQAERSKAVKAKQKAVEALTDDQLADLDGFIDKQDLSKMLRQRFNRGHRGMLRQQFIDDFLPEGARPLDRGKRLSSEQG
ncbi:MAG: hypothetical protein JEZ12_11790 [Desulfobacterium sp.]|nr:hypothetical protein [Desulfobacterium sp.]